MQLELYVDFRAKIKVLFKICNTAGTLKFFKTLVTAFLIFQVFSEHGKVENYKS